MLDDIAGELDIGSFDVLSGFDPADLPAAAAQYDAILAQYRQVYDRVGLPIRHYADIDEMIADGETIEMTCRFCDNIYKFDIDELKKIREEQNDR